MTRQWGRQVRLLVGGTDGQGLDLSALRMTFDVRQSDFLQPNNANIRVYNVAPETARRAEREFTRVVLQAGYEGNVATIFDGTIVQTRLGRESQTDTYLHITAMDGDMALNYAVVNKSYAAGSRPEDRLAEAVRAGAQYGLQAGHITQGSEPALPRGVVMFGMARDAIRDEAEALGASASVQNNRLQVLAHNEPLPGEAVVINAQTGMVGMPEQTAEGITFTALLNPRLRIGQAVRIDNRSIQRAAASATYEGQKRNFALQEMVPLDRDGLYRVLVADHIGDTRGNPFYTKAICYALGTAPPAALSRGLPVVTE